MTRLQWFDVRNRDGRMMRTMAEDKDKARKKAMDRGFDDVEYVRPIILVRKDDKDEDNKE